MRREDVEIGYNSTNASNGLTHTGDNRNHRDGNNTKTSKNSYESETKKSSQNSVEFTSEKRKPSLVAVLNQGLANLGERLCKSNIFYFLITYSAVFFVPMTIILFRSYSWQRK